MAHYTAQLTRIFAKKSAYDQKHVYIVKQIPHFYSILP